MDFYSLCEDDIKDVEREIELLISNREKRVFGILPDFIKRGGKRTRPLLLFLSFYAFGGKMQKDVIKQAALIEMFHNFTLIHDDIEDNSKFRRGKPTLHIEYGTPMALNSGDALYTLVWNEFLKNDFSCEKKIEIIQMCSNAFLEVVEGQGVEIFWEKENVFDITEQDYFDMVNKKTAALIALSCRIGGYLAGATREEQDAMEKFGRNIGIAFQVWDDVLNLTADFKKYKKEIGGDITEGKRTLMVIKALEKATSEDRKRLIEILSSHSNKKTDITQAIDIMKKYGAIDYATERAKRLVSEGKKSIDLLKSSRYKDALLALADYIVSREG